jgi:ABC-2 type transport system permease protein
MALLLSASNVFLRDTEHIVGIVSLAWFFLTPIFYPVELQLAALPPNLSWAAFLNPMSGIVWAYRGILMAEAAPDLPPDPAAVLISAAVAWAVLFAGIAAFQKCQIRFADEL